MATDNAAIRAGSSPNPLNFSMILNVLQEQLLPDVVGDSTVQKILNNALDLEHEMFSPRARQCQAVALFEHATRVSAQWTAGKIYLWAPHIIRTE